MSRHAAAHDGDAGAGGAGVGGVGTAPVVVLDAESLQRLRELDPQGRSQLLAKVIEAFRGSTARLLPQMVEAARGGNADRVRHVAHTLKSSSASLGALQLSRLCAELEQQLRVGEATDLDRQVGQIAAEIDGVMEALDALIGAAR